LFLAVHLSPHLLVAVAAHPNLVARHLLPVLVNLALLLVPHHLSPVVVALVVARNLLAVVLAPHLSHRPAVPLLALVNLAPHLRPVPQSPHPVPHLALQNLPLRPVPAAANLLVVRVQAVVSRQVLVRLAVVNHLLAAAQAALSLHLAQVHRLVQNLVHHHHRAAVSRHRVLRQVLRRVLLVLRPVHLSPVLPLAPHPVAQSPLVRHLQVVQNHHPVVVLVLLSPLAVQVVVLLNPRPVVHHLVVRNHHLVLVALPAQSLVALVAVHPAQSLAVHLAPLVPLNLVVVPVPVPLSPVVALVPVALKLQIHPVALNHHLHPVALLLSHPLHLALLVVVQSHLVHHLPAPLNLHLALVPVARNPLHLAAALVRSLVLPVALVAQKHLYPHLVQNRLHLAVHPHPNHLARPVVLALVALSPALVLVLQVQNLAALLLALVLNPLLALVVVALSLVVPLAVPLLLSLALVPVLAVPLLLSLALLALPARKLVLFLLFYQLINGWQSLV